MSTISGVKLIWSAERDNNLAWNVSLWERSDSYCTIIKLLWWETWGRELSCGEETEEIKNSNATGGNFSFRSSVTAWSYRLAQITVAFVQWNNLLNLVILTHPYHQRVFEIENDGDYYWFVPLLGIHNIKIFTFLQEIFKA